jgi:N-acetylneuraminic acid mutarotase
MQQARGGLGVATVNGKIYAIGGSVASSHDNVKGSQLVGTNEEYDPATDTWTFKMPMPTPRWYFGVAVYKNKIYCIGGQTKVGEVNGYAQLGQIGVNEVYDPATDTWETKTPMPTVRSHLGANLVNGKIYLIEGVGSRHANEVYDPETDSWTEKTLPPNGDFQYASAVVDNKIYIIGGTQNSNRNQIYDPENDSWSLGESALEGVLYGAAGATTGVMAPKRVYVFGVTYQIGMAVPPFKTQVYDPANDSWIVGASAPINRINLGIAVVNDTLYAIGGQTHEEWGFVTPSAANEQYTPIGYGTIPVDNDRPEPEPFPVAPVAAASATVIVAGAGFLVYFKKRKH